MRAVLAILIAVTQLAGPWLCCCGPLRVVACAEPKPETRTPASPRKIGSGCLLCVAGDQCGAKKKPDVPKHDSPKPPPCQDRCPWAGAELVTAPVTAGERFDGKLAALFVPVSVEPTVRLPVEPLAPADPPGLRELPLLTVADRLYTHHALRC